MQKELRNYINSIKREIICTRKQKSELITQIKEAIEDIMLSNPNVTLIDITKTIGSPKEIAKSYNTANIEYMRSKIKELEYTTIGLFVIFSLCFIILLF